MKTQTSTGSAPVRRGVMDPRSTGAPSSQTRKTLNDSRSTR
jgi:hypothetical protein